MLKYLHKEQVQPFVGARVLLGKKIENQSIDKQSTDTKTSYCNFRRLILVVFHLKGRNFR